jgi:hypothetical protein
MFFKKNFLKSFRGDQSQIDLNSFLSTNSNACALPTATDLREEYQMINAFWVLNS